MTLDSHRNSILQLNMRVAIATLALTGMAVPAGIFGMNLNHGFEEVHNMHDLDLVFPPNDWIK